MCCLPALGQWHTFPGTSLLGARLLHMTLRQIADRAFEVPLVYRSLQAPFAEKKLAPFLRDFRQGPAKSILDVGCGPGTNARHFRNARYTGIDLNPDYIASAQRRFAGRFLVGDVTDASVFPAERFDCVLVNSLMHHLDDEAVRGLLSRLPRVVAPGGHMYILDLVMPLTLNAAWMFARLDRGRHARSITAWRVLFSASFSIETFVEFPLGFAGLELWRMVYCKGKPR